MTDLITVLVNALSVGSMYALLALGLAMVFAILGLVNFAHGELIAVTAAFCLLSTVIVQPALLRVGSGALGAMTKR